MQKKQIIVILTFYILIFLTNMIYFAKIGVVDVYIYIFLCSTNAIGIISGFISIYSILTVSKSEKFLKKIYFKKKPLSSRELENKYSNLKKKWYSPHNIILKPT